eukprot:Partr_v1_DN27240_c0_g2_i2_m39012 putative Histone acetyltransferase
MIDPMNIPSGSKVQVRKPTSNTASNGRGDQEDIEWRESELLATRTLPNGKLQFYVHYVNFNKRLDEWVDLDMLNLQSVRMASESSGAGAGGGGGHSGPGRKSHKKQQQASIDVKMPIVAASSASTTGDQPPPPAPPQVQEELENLRRGGSMTNNPEEVHRVKNINSIIIGKHRVETWYFSPYPPQLTMSDAVYICEFCLCYFDCKTRLGRHRLKCTLMHPPGNEIYRRDGVSFFEIDGNKQRVYCRNLCLLSKLFLDHKTLYYDVNPFLFYVMTQNDELGHHIVGYFSKEKESLDGYNVACILTLPNHQRKGYGRMLIAFSYELSKKEGKLGSPEKPLSDLGLLSYRTYWSEVLIQYFFTTADQEISVEDLSALMCMTTDDVLHTLHHLDLLRYYNGQYIIVLADRHREMYDKLMSKKRTLIDPKALDWKPPVFTASQLRYL